MNTDDTLEYPPTSTLSAEARSTIAALADRQSKASGLLMKAANFMGGKVEDGLQRLPEATRTRLEEVSQTALTQSYDLAAKSRSGVGEKIGSDRMHRALGTITGALGGFGGLPTAMIELPVVTTVFFRAVQGVAAEYGEDPLSPETRIECLAVFGSGTTDADIDKAVAGARMSLSGAAINGLISKVAPRFAAVLSQKLATQSVPVIGAAAGAGTNYAFVDYYVALAHVHFGLRKLTRTYGAEVVNEEFLRAKIAADQLQT